MAIYPLPPAHERLNVFFGELFREMRKAPPEIYGQFLMRAEEAFKRTGYRDETKRGGIETILVVRLDAIGDMILTSGFLRELRKNFPRARITLVVSPLAFPLVELCPYVNEVLTFDKNSLSGNFVEVLEKIAVFCRDNLWQKKFSHAFSPRWHNDTIIELLTIWCSGARERIGYGTNPFKSWLGDPPAEVTAQDNFLLTKNVITPQNIISDVDKNFYLLAATGFKLDKFHMELFYDAQNFQHAKELLENIPSTCKKVLLGIGASALSKKYPAEKYLVALKVLAKKNLVFVIVGGKSELDDAKFIENNLPSEKVLNLVGKTTLRETEAVIAQTDFYVGNDTGVVHMAAANQIPCLVLYRGAQDRENILPAIINEFKRFPPYQTHALVLRPVHPLDECATLPPIFGLCRKFNSPHCITQIAPQKIVDAFEALENLK